jgi:hypothetical protein
MEPFRSDPMTNFVHQTHTMLSSWSLEVWAGGAIVAILVLAATIFILNFRGEMW